MVAQIREFERILAMHSSSSFSFEKAMNKSETVSPIILNSSNKEFLIIPQGITDNAFTFNQSSLLPSKRQMKDVMANGTNKHQPIFLKVVGNKIVLSHNTMHLDAICKCNVYFTYKQVK